MIIDYWKLWSQKTSTSIDFVAAPWAKTLTMVGEGAVDAHAGLFYNEERDQYLEYGSPLRQTDTHVFFHRSIPATAQYEELSAYRIGVVAGDYVEGFLQERIPNGFIVGFDDYESIVEALQSGALRVFAADTPTGLHHLKEANLSTEFYYVASSPLYRSDWFTAAQEGDTATIRRINNGMALISEDEKRQIGRRWIGDIQTTVKDDALIISMDRAYPPFSFINAQGKPAGLFVDLWQAWGEQTGQPIRFRSSNWQGTLQSLKTGESDLHSGLSYSEERAEWIAFSNQIYQTASRIYHRSGDDIPADIANFADRVLGVWAGTYQESEAKRLYAHIHLRAYQSSRDMIDALIKGEIDALLQEDLVMDQLLQQLGLQGEVVSRPERLLISPIHSGVAKEQIKLLKTINDGLDRLSLSTLTAIEARWISDPTRRFYGRTMYESEVGLTIEERNWLNAHPLIQLGSDVNWPPYEYIDQEGQYRGLSAAFLKRIGEILGIRFQPPSAIPWQETLQRAQNRKVDLLTSVAPAPERHQYLLFTMPYIAWPNVIAVRSDRTDISSADDLEGMKVGVVEGYAIQDVIAREHPNALIVPVLNVSQGLQALSSGGVDALVDSPVSIRHFAEEQALSNIVFVAATPYQLELALGVRRDWPELVTILNKALAKIDSEERARLADDSGISARVTFDLRKAGKKDLLSTQEAALLILAAIIVLILLLFLAKAIRSQEKPLFKSLRGKSLLFLAGVFLLIGSGTLWLLSFFGDRLSLQLGEYVAERHVLWHKEKVLGAVQRELALARQMAGSEILIQWAQDEENPQKKDLARDELQRFHDNFATQSYFVGLKGSKHFFYADDKTEHVDLTVVDTLSLGDQDDIWFFKTMDNEDAYNLNVDHNAQLGLTNVWVNYALRRGDETYGVVGTGIQLTNFIQEFIAQRAEGVSAMMIDSNGAIHAHADPTMVAHNVLGQRGAGHKDIWQLLTNEEEHDLLRKSLIKLRTGESPAETILLNIEGRPSLVSISYLEPLKWYTLAIFEPGTVVGPEEIGTVGAVLGLALLITVTIFLLGQNHLILKPLNKLTKGAQQLSDRDYGVRLKVSQRDEIGELTETFNDMAATIADYTGNLENKVAERTRDLKDRELRLKDALEVISGSIRYASRIQHSILPLKQNMKTAMPEHFVVWEPRDVVGGDVYWCRPWGDGHLVMLGDCTGHGVPGAFMTMIANGALGQACREVEVGNPAQITGRMHQLIQSALGQHLPQGASDDGLELGACYIPSRRDRLSFAGARFSLFLKDQGNDIVEIKGDKKGIGYRGIPQDAEFSNHEIDLLVGRRFYMTSDGLIDQVGGDRRRGFGKKRFKLLLDQLFERPIESHGDIIMEALVEHQGTEKRRDDVCVIGFTFSQLGKQTTV